MTPRHGEIWLVDMGMAAKTRPTVVLIADNLDAPRSQQSRLRSRKPAPCEPPGAAVACPIKTSSLENSGSCPDFRADEMDFQRLLEALDFGLKSGYDPIRAR